MFVHVRYDEDKKKTECFYGIDEIHVQKQDLRTFDGDPYWIYKMTLDKLGDEEIKLSNVLDFEVY